MSLAGPALSGFLLGAGLIIAIGAQNAYVLRMGLLRHHVLAICLFCAVSDALLIVVGVSGFGMLVERVPGLLTVITTGGAVFLSVYALVALRRALQPGRMQIDDGATPSLSSALAACAAFTWLNPHVYVDTVMLIGAFAARYEEAQRIAYAAGACTASFAWFFSLGYGARLLAPLFERRIAWQILDGLISIIMALLAWRLYTEVF